MIKHLHIGLLSIVVALLSSQAHALLIVQGNSISHSQTGSTTTVNDRFFDPFDPALGTLNSVRLQVNGLLVVSGTYTPFLAPTPGGPIPIPYQFHFEVDHSLYGLGHFNGFGFGTPARYIFDAVIPGVPQPYAFVTPFTYNITFNDITDLIGFALPSGIGGPTIPPLYINGERSDFFDYPFSQLFGGLWMHSRVDGIDSSLLPNAPNVSVNGGMILTYDYTPAPPPPPDDNHAVPEPGSLFLLGLGIASLALSRRKREAAR